MRLAMRIGNDYRDRSILRGNVTRLCKECNFPVEQLFTQARELIEKIRVEVPQLKPIFSKQKCWNATLEKLSDSLLKRIERSAALFQ